MKSFGPPVKSSQPRPASHPTGTAVPIASVFHYGSKIGITCAPLQAALRSPRISHQLSRVTFSPRPIHVGHFFSANLFNRRNHLPHGVADAGTQIQRY